MRRRLPIVPLLAALFVSLAFTFLSAQSADAAGRMREVGGYGLVLRDTPTFAFGSLDSATNGTARAGEIVYINGWQIGVYHIGENRWVAASAVQPIIDSAGRSMTSSVTWTGSGYTLNGRAITLPARRSPYAEQFLNNPTLSAPITYSSRSVPSDLSTELVDTSKVWFSPGERVVATMRVTELYNFIYLRTEPRADAPVASYNAYANEVLTAYEVVDNQWYRIGKNVWAPRTWGSEILMVPENVASYAPAEYYNGGKWIAIDLDRQRLTAWEGNDVVVSTAVKTGKYGYHTPAGVWKTFDKVPNERMSGSDYDLMDVAWTQYFTRSGIAIHTAYWHNNYNGRPGSHGCVNTPEDKARTLFMWAPLGTTVVTHNPYVFDAQDIADAQKWSQFER